MRFRELRVDPDLYEQGSWIRYDAESEFKLAAYGNLRFQFALTRAVVAGTPSTAAGANDDSELERAARFRRAEIDSLAGHVLLDWRGVKADDSDDEREFSVEAAAAELRACPDFAKWVIASAHQLRHFRAQAEDSAGKA
jgi:hypothetical protein